MCDSDRLKALLSGVSVLAPAARDPDDGQDATAVQQGLQLLLLPWRREGMRCDRDAAVSDTEPFRKKIRRAAFYFYVGGVSMKAIGNFKK